MNNETNAGTQHILNTHRERALEGTSPRARGKQRSNWL